MRWAVFLLAGGCAGPRPEPPRVVAASVAEPEPVRVEPRADAWSPEPRATTHEHPSGCGKPEHEACAEAEAWSLARAGEPGALAWLQARLAAVPAPSPILVAAQGLLDRPAYASEEAWTTAEHGWWGRYAVASDLWVQRAWLFVFARQGTAVSQHRLAADLLALPAASESTARHRWGFEAMGMACARDVPPSSLGVEAMGVGLLGGPEIAPAAAYAVARCARLLTEGLSGIDVHAWGGALGTLLTASPRVAAVAWRAFAALEHVPPVIPEDVLLRPQEDPEAWLAEVEAVRALARHPVGQRELVRRLAAAPLPEGARVHVVLEALRRLRGRVAAAPELLDTLAPLASVLASAHGATATWIACELALLQAIVAGKVDALARCGDPESDLPETWRAELAVEAMYHVWRRGGAARGQAIEHLLDAAADPRAAVAQAGLSALAEVADPRVNGVLRAALRTTDPGVRTAAAGVVARRAASIGRSDREAIPLLVALLAESGVAWIEARVSAVRALGAFARAERASGDHPPAWLGAALLPSALDPARAVREAAYAVLRTEPTLRDVFVAAVATGAARDDVAPTSEPEPPVRGLRVELERGAFTIHFGDGAAPRARAQFVALARRGFFDGTRMHRVVPGFVVQGGDPRGDGYGGPGEVLPCERSTPRFRRGTVGVASAGPDTGGSQFFVTTNDQPHLDGRFTVLGHVDPAEQPLVDAILPHERVLTVRPLEEAT